MRLTKTDKAVIAAALVTAKTSAEATVKTADNLIDLREAVRTLDSIESTLAKVTDNATPDPTDTITGPPANIGGGGSSNDTASAV